tara:strand:- start:2606 stop:3406 length:801 start_codon:yes stop_codon:yes gene_type:complete
VAISGPIPGTVIRRRATSLLGATGDLHVELLDLCFHVRECRDQGLERGNSIGWQAACRVFDDCNQLRCIRCPLWHDLSEFAQMPSQCVDGLGPLPDQKLADPKHHRSALRLLTLHGHEPHRRAQCGLTDRLGIRRVVLLAFYKGLHVSRRDKPHRMAQLADLAPPKMSAATGLHRDDTGRKLTEELQNLCPSQLLAQSGTASAISPMHLKYVLRQIEPDRDNLQHDRPPFFVDHRRPTFFLCGSSQTHLGTSMPSGGGHIIKADPP